MKREEEKKNTHEKTCYNWRLFCALIKDWGNECYTLFPFEPTDISEEEMRWMECEIRNVVWLA